MKMSESCWGGAVRWESGDEILDANLAAVISSYGERDFSSCFQHVLTAGAGRSDSEMHKQRRANVVLTLDRSAKQAQRHMVLGAGDERKIAVRVSKFRWDGQGEVGKSSSCLVSHCTVLSPDRLVDVGIRGNSAAVIRVVPYMSIT
eukprot:756486-Hanusia_phi.AAC.1